MLSLENENKLDVAKYYDYQLVCFSAGPSIFPCCSKSSMHKSGMKNQRSALVFPRRSTIVSHSIR